MGVTMFFVVSAFSLCYMMPRHKREARPLVSFYLRRFFRIAPLFYFMIATTLFYHAQFMGVPLDYWAAKSEALVASVFFVFNFLPGQQLGVVWASWTIGVEMPFYLLFPLLYRRFDNPYKAGAFLPSQSWLQQ